jgi:hypothetical protein
MTVDCRRHYCDLALHRYYCDDCNRRHYSEAKNLDCVLCGRQMLYKGIFCQAHGWSSRHGFHEQLSLFEDDS